MSSTYYSQARPEIRALVNAVGSRVLDVGCGEGIVGAQLKADGAAYVAGIELHGPASALARTRLDMVLEGSVTDVEMPFSDGEFDYLIFADVLEHLPDPDAVLRHCLPLLRPDGRVVVSVPNWRFYLVLLRLIVDRWEYTDHGVRDRTHLRVFTRRALDDLLSRHGLELEQLVRNQRLFEDQSRIGRAGALATRLSNATLGRWVFRELLTFQYVALARGGG